MYDEDPALADEDVDGGSGGGQNGGRAADMADEEEGPGQQRQRQRRGRPLPPEYRGGEAREGRAEHRGHGPGRQHPSREHVLLRRLRALAYGKTAELSHKAENVYPGPPFGSLDEDLQVLMERYLEERGITQALAVFVPDYIDMKEQRELPGLAEQREGIRG